MPESAPPPEIEGLSLSDILRLSAEKRLPPIHEWNPERSGDSEMRIARDGTWYHQGEVIPRPAMVRLFASILRREPDGGFVLVTPVEKLTIEVEDAPFTATVLINEGDGKDRRLAFQLNTGDVVVADAEHPIRWEEKPDGPHPYLHVRAGLEALVTRPVYYELVELALAEASEPVGLWSEGTFFSFQPTA